VGLMTGKKHLTTQYQQLGWVAERFKAPVLKFGCGCPGAYRDIPKRGGSSGFSGLEIVSCPFSSHRVLPSSVANRVAKYPRRSHGLGSGPSPTWGPGLAITGPCCRSACHCGLSRRTSGSSNGRYRCNRRDLKRPVIGNIARWTIRRWLIYAVAQAGTEVARLCRSPSLVL